MEVAGHRLAFHKRGVDGSGKCDLYSDKGSCDKVHGVVYELDEQGKAKLDEVEGKHRGYAEKVVQVSLHGVTRESYLYIAQPSHIDPGLVPYHWYKGLVLAGARYHGFPTDYLAAIEATPSVTDPDVGRTRENEGLLTRMLA